MIRRFAPVLSALAALAVLATEAAPVVTTVDPAAGSYSSLRLNAGNPVVSYYDAGNGDLKLATCTAGCGSASPTWVIVTVDSGGDVGRYTSLQLNGGSPVIAYNDVTNGSLKLATCTASCASAAPTWVIVTVDRGSADTGRFPSLQLTGGNPVISYRDRTNGDLRLATCTANCATANPAWTLVAVETAGDVGRYDSMQLDGERPVIAYLDAQAILKVATCLAACAGAAPTWVISVVDHVRADQETQISLQLDAGRPVVSYYDTDNGDLKLATCTGACASAAPSWVVSTVDGGGHAPPPFTTGALTGANAGQYSSLQVVAGKPVVAYHGGFINCTKGPPPGNLSCTESADLRLAVCTADCATAAAAWVVTTLDNAGLVGWDPSMQVEGGRVVASYLDFIDGALKLASVDLASASRPVNHTALWWNSDQSGWGINFAHQGDIVFGTLFTYDAAGEPMWLVMPQGTRRSGSTYSGTLYRTTGPAFNASPFTPIGPANVSEVGTMTVSFAGDTAALSYTVNGSLVDKTVRKQVFGEHAAECHPAVSERAGLGHYQDLWWNPAESGWGINLTQQGDVIFATLFTYDAAGKGLWLVLPAGTRQSDGSYSGDLYRTTGPAFNAAPWRAIGAANITRVGTMQLRFSNGTSGTLGYSYNGVTVVKAITRQEFSAPLAACAS